MDDIKESVRVAAGKTAQSLSRVSIKMTDSSLSSGSKSGEAVKAILPALLKSGLASSVVEVRVISLATIMKFNYLSTRLGGGEVQERLDMTRMTASKTSATMECVNYVLQFVDTEVLVAQLVPRLVVVCYYAVVVW